MDISTMTGDRATDHGGLVEVVQGGHDVPLAGIDEARVGFPVRVREIDHRDEATAHEVLTDIMAGQAEGTFDCSIHYKGKRPGYWMGCLSPEVLAPKYLGLFSPAGELLGWFSLTFTLGRPDLASLGIVVREPWRDKGIGTAATRHAVALKGTLLARPIGTLLITTKASNVRMMRIARKVGLHDLGKITDAGTGQARRTFATSPVVLSPAI
jgi:RimJ/RimL family protein N-acetyltransferase